MLLHISPIRFNFQGTFCLNSLAHSSWAGTQPYSTNNTARNVPLLAILVGGEGNHSFIICFRQIIETELDSFNLISRPILFDYVEYSDSHGISKLSSHLKSNGLDQGKKMGNIHFLGRVSEFHINVVPFANLKRSDVLLLFSIQRADDNDSLSP